MDTAKMTTAIELKQKPIIAHKLIEVGKSVTERLNAANVDGQIATVDTVKGLKDLRATLNKELEEYESQRKFVKAGILNPYDEFEVIYKTEISEKYKSAIDKLKDKIAFVEDKIKSDKKLVIKAYFEELCMAEKIDFLTFDNLGLDINLSTSEKAYKEQVNAFVERVKDDISLIKATDYEAEIMVEYKIALNASKAITCVKTRKESEKAEADRPKAQETIRRKTLLAASGLVYDEMTNCYAYDNDLYMKGSDIEGYSKEDFQKKIIELEEAIKEKKATNQPELFQESGKPTEFAQPFVNSMPMITPTPKPIAPIQAPIVEKAPEVMSASFEVTGTMAQLKALGQYMKDNNINYKNI